MSYNSNIPHSGPAGAQSNTPISFNQMLQRSQQEQMHQEAPVEAPGHPPQAIGEPNSVTFSRISKYSRATGYGGVYNATPPPQQLPPNALGGGRAPSTQPVLPIDLPPQAFLTSSMLLDMVDSMELCTSGLPTILTPNRESRRFAPR